MGYYERAHKKDEDIRKAKEQTDETLRRAVHKADIEGSREIKQDINKQPPLPDAAKEEKDALFYDGTRSEQTPLITIKELEDELRHLYASYAIRPDDKTRRAIRETEERIEYRKKI